MTSDYIENNIFANKFDTDRFILECIIAKHIPERVNKYAVYLGTEIEFCEYANVTSENEYTSPVITKLNEVKTIFGNKYFNYAILPKMINENAIYFGNMPLIYIRLFIPKDVDREALLGYLRIKGYIDAK